MCAIIDTNVVAEAFGRHRTPTGQAFRDSVDDRGLRLVVGGELLDELDKDGNFRRWRAVASQYGRVQTVKREIVEPLAAQIRSSCVSNDAHIVALAQASGARLLFSNDRELHRDFKDRQLIDDPRGKIISTLDHASLTRGQKRLLTDRSLCMEAPQG